MAVEVTVIIAHRNDPHLMNTVRLLIEQQVCFNYEVVVVDDNSDPKYRPNGELLAMNDVRYIQLDQQVGCGEARNIGVGKTDSPMIAFADSDLEFHPDWLRCGYETVAPNLAVTGPVPKRHRSSRPSLAERYNEIESPHAHGTRTYGTGNLFLMREDFKRVGWFNSALIRGHDMDFFSRWDGDIQVVKGMTASHPSKNHREKVQTIRELVRDWKRLGHRPSFARRVFPDRNLLQNVMKSNRSALDKMLMIGYHFYLKGVYVWYWATG